MKPIFTASSTLALAALICTQAVAAEPAAGSINSNQVNVSHELTTLNSSVNSVLGDVSNTAASIGNEIDVVLAESGRTISVGKRRALVRALADQSISFDGRDRARMVPLVIAFSEEPGA